MIAERLTVYPGALRGRLAAPSSKSMMQRVLATLLLRPASMNIHNVGASADEQVVLNVLRDAGFSINVGDDYLQIERPLVQLPVRHVEFGESGLAARMLTPILALQDTVVRLDALPGLRARPMRFLVDELPRLSVRVASNGGHLPASIHGPLKAADIRVDASQTSQTLTGLLMAYAGGNAWDATISVSNLVSKPYIDLTLQVMALTGLPVPHNQNYEAFYFPAEPAWGKPPGSISIEGDWSGAAFMLVAGAIAGQVVVTGLDAFSTQADRMLLAPLMDCGIQLSVESSQITAATSALKAFHFDARNCPDLFPPLAALACNAHGTSVIEGVSRLLHKESNRAESIISELGKMGAEIFLQDDLMIIRGVPLHGAAVSSHNDHRIAMMCAVAALRADGPTNISGAGAVAKSYPRFWEDLQRLGVQIELAAG